MGYARCKVVVKKAPTYVEEVKEEKAQKATWVCSICGYVYDGDDFENEDDTYVCPICTVPKDLFEKR